MRYGTSYFPTRLDAYKYYSVMGFEWRDVIYMLERHEIHIGKPPGLNSLRRAVAQKDQGGSKRYFIYEDIRIG